MYIKRPLCIFSLIFVLLLTLILCLFRETTETDEALVSGQELIIEGKIFKIEEKNNKHIIHLSINSPPDQNPDSIISQNTHFYTDPKFAGRKLKVYLSDDEKMIRKLHMGQTVSICARFEKFKKAYNNGGFDMQSYYENKHYIAVCYDAKIVYAYTSYSYIKDLLYRVKKRTSSLFEYYFEEKYSGVVKALVLADKNDLDEELKEQYKNAGISHILALSGLHIVTMGILIFKLLSRMGIKRIVSISVAAGLIILYCIMTGMPVSGIRALIMFLLSMFAILIGRTNDLRTSASVAAVLMLIFDPNYLYEASFILSFCAVLGIGLIYPSVRGIVLYLLGKDRILLLHRSDKRWVRFVMGVLRTLLFSASIQLGIIPVTMWFYYQIPVYGIFINLIVVPLATFLLMGSVLTAILGNLEIMFNIPVGIAKIPAYLTTLILKLYDYITLKANTLPGGLWVTGRPELWQMIIYYILLFIIVMAGFTLQDKEKKLKSLVRKKKRQSREVRYKMLKFLRTRAAVLLGLCVITFGVLLIRTGPEYEITSLYVGQGQCFVVHGRKVPTLIYDCGSTDQKEIAKYTVVPFLKYTGIKNVDTVFISHLDTDHVSGIIEILNSDSFGINIKRIILPDGNLQKQSENYGLLCEAALNRKVPVYIMRKGDEIKWKKLRAMCLSPAAEAAYEDINEGSLVLDVKYEENREGARVPDTEYEGKREGVRADSVDSFKFLFTGDISSAVEQQLIDEGLTHYEGLQIAHHGSKKATCNEFIEAVSPRIAVISAGIGNRYGHPAVETLERLENHDIFYAGTLEGGQISMEYDKDRDIKVRRYEHQ
ncbi:MAG: ComEC/Rec2 family competence protein [Lachnospiraceae bacterium]|nr:ComEC/Rec2 family competence protein [Lachnospiraceae bacterium]